MDKKLLAKDRQDSILPVLKCFWVDFSLVNRNNKNVQQQVAASVKNGNNTAISFSNTRLWSRWLWKGRGDDANNNPAPEGPGSVHCTLLY